MQAVTSTLKKHVIIKISSESTAGLIQDVSFKILCLPKPVTSPLMLKNII